MEFTFQQDNAPIHTSFEIKQWLAAKIIKTMTWPASSPVLNPIENGWGILARAVYPNCTQFETVDELKCFVVAECESLGLDLFYKLVGLMQKCCIEVLRLERRKTSYYVALQGTVFIKIFVFCSRLQNALNF